LVNVFRKLTVNQLLLVFSYVFVVVSAFILRMWNVFSFNKLIFDEKYYVKDGYSVLKYGYEKQWVPNYQDNGTPLWEDTMLANSLLFAEGNYVIESSEWWSAHPPLGKIFIALGMLLFGHDSPFGWRAAAIIAGTLIVGLSMFLAFILSRNHFVSLTAGGLIATDGLLITMSRVSYLDIFLTLMLLVAFIFFVLFYRERKVKHFYLFAVFSGLAMAVKWSAFFFILAAFIALMVLLIVDKFKTGEFSFKLLGHYILGGIISIGVYVAGWSLWLATYASQYANNIFEAFKKLVDAHVYMLTMLDGANNKQMSNNSYFTEWLTVATPSFFLLEKQDDYSQIIVAMPNLIVWWLAALVLLIFTLLTVFGKASHNVILLVGVVAALWLPWGLITERVTFQYYAASFTPYLLILLAYAVFKTKHIFMKPIYFPVTITILILTGMLSVVLYPLNTGMVISEDSIMFNFISIWFNMF
jgi:dolichyl-phosphate-mannose-protein mannosyltransferase